MTREGPSAGMGSANNPHNVYRLKVSSWQRWNNIATTNMATRVPASNSPSISAYIWIDCIVFIVEKQAGGVIAMRAFCSRRTNPLALKEIASAGWKEHPAHATT